MRNLLFLTLCSCILPLQPALGGYGLRGGHPNAIRPQNHTDEFFITLFNSSYQPLTCYYDHKQATYFSRDGINNLFYYPSDKYKSAENFLRKAKLLEMNGIIWFPEFWVNQDFGAYEYEQWVKGCSGNHANLFGWFMPDELPMVLMRADKKRNPIFDPANPKLHDPKNSNKPWFFNKQDPDAMNTVIGRTRWYAKRIRNMDPKSHVIISPGNGGAMSDLRLWVTTLENLAEYCNVWIRVVYPNWVIRPRVMLIYEYEQWLKCREQVKKNGTNVEDLYFMLLLESFKGPYSNRINYIKPEIIRFDAYASLTLGSQGLMWWEGKSWDDPKPEAQAMYAAIRRVAREINIPYGVHLAPCLLADEPEQHITASVISGPRLAPPYYGNKYDSIQVRLKQEGAGGQLYLFVANFSERWKGKSFRNSGGAVRARFRGFENDYRRAQVIVDSRASRQSLREIAIQNGAFVDDFPELTARVYQILK